MSGLKITSAKKAYGDVEVLHDVNLDISKGEFIVFVGPSGCGKSTLLRMIAGLEDITAGTMEIEGTVVNAMPPSKRGIAMVFQSYALYPHMSVYDNMAFGMKIARASKDEIDTRVRSAAEKLQLTQYLDRLPKALSGGQRQRVAIGRAIVRDPKVFLFDEPLSNLDAALRVATRIEIAKLKESMPDATMIYVTHDQVEAMTLADRIVVLSGGYVEQVGAPIELYENPHNLFVAQFIGSPAMNIMPATVEQTGKETVVALQSGDHVKVPIASPEAMKGATVHFGVRPEDLRLAEPDGGVLHGTVSMTESLGEVTLAYLDGTGSEEPMTVKMPGNQSIQRGQRLSLDAAAKKLHLFNDAGISLRHLN